MTPDDDSVSRNARVLIVEDEYLIADDLAMILEDLGHDVVGPVATIEDALALVRDEPLDAALLDANLDGVSSAPIAEALNARSVPFIVVTGYGGLTLDSADLQGARRITKPLEPAKLANALEETLATTSPARGGPAA